MSAKGTVLKRVRQSRKANSRNRHYKSMMKTAVKNILDIGCGIGAINIFLNNYYKKEKPNFHLLDKNYVSNKIIYGFNKKNTEGYNNLLITKNFLKANNLIEENIYTYDVEKHELKKIKSFLCENV